MFVSIVNQNTTLKDKTRQFEFSIIVLCTAATYPSSAIPFVALTKLLSIILLNSCFILYTKGGLVGGAGRAWALSHFADPCKFT